MQGILVTLPQEAREFVPRPTTGVRHRSHYFWCARLDASTMGRGQETPVDLTISESDAEIPAQNVSPLENFCIATQLSPAAYAFVYGTNFGETPKVFIGTTPCPLFYVTDTFISIQVPSTSSTGPANLTVQTAAGSSAPFPFVIFGICHAGTAL